MPDQVSPPPTTVASKAEKMSEKSVFIVETKGLEEVDLPQKMARLAQWCEDVNRVQSDVNWDYVFVDQEGFEKYKPSSFRQVLDGFREYKTG